MLGGTPNFNGRRVTIHDSEVVYGSTITALISFVIVAAVICFAVVIPTKTISARKGVEEDTSAPSAAPRAAGSDRGRPAPGATTLDRG